MCVSVYCGNSAITNIFVVLLETYNKKIKTDLEVTEKLFITIIKNLEIRKLKLFYKCLFEGSVGLWQTH